MDGKEPIRHCVLISNSIPHQSGAKCNLTDKYGGFKFDDIVTEMRAVNKIRKKIAQHKAKNACCIDKN